MPPSTPDLSYVLYILYLPLSEASIAANEADAADSEEEEEGDGTVDYLGNGEIFRFGLQYNLKCLLAYCQQAAGVNI